MKTPKYVISILGNPQKFAYLYFHHLKGGQSSEDAYETALNEVRQYAPNFSPLRQHESEYRRYYLERDDVEVPQEVIDAVTGQFDVLMDSFYLKNQIRKEAYDLAIQYIQKYIPKWLPASSYESYKSLISQRHKVKRKTKR